MKVIIVDLFCGAGGASEGALAAAKGLGLDVEVYAINCWQEAIDTYKANHPFATTLCQRVEQVIPEQLIPGRRIHLLIAGPECTHHSQARGGMPIDDQKRVPAWVVPNWLQRMVVDNVVIENVSEFQNWGPLGVNGQPSKSRRGEIFKQYLATIQSCGYEVDYRVLCCADYGDATTRKRLFIVATRKGAVTWPAITHVSREKLRQLSLVTTALKPYRAAREIIDWGLKGQNIFDRKRPLAPKTMKRIAAGMKKINGLDIEPFLVKLYGTAKTASVEKPLPTVTASGGHLALVEPFVLSQASGGAGRPVSEPIPAICTKGAEQLVEPFVVTFDHQGTSGSCSNKVGNPLTTITTKGRHGVVEPFMVAAGGPEGKGRQPQSIDSPLGTVLTENHQALCQPFVVVVNHGDKTEVRDRSQSVEDPLLTVTTKNGYGVTEPFLTKYYGTGTFQPVSDPLDTVTTKERFALVEPKLIKVRDGIYLGIRFRMLQDYELAAAHGFDRSFKFTKTKSVNVKLVGNSWPKETATALCRERLVVYAPEAALSLPSLISPELPRHCEVSA